MANELMKTAGFVIHSFTAYCSECGEEEHFEEPEGDCIEEQIEWVQHDTKWDLDAMICPSCGAKMAHEADEDQKLWEWSTR